MLQCCPLGQNFSDIKEVETGSGEFGLNLQFASLEGIGNLKQKYPLDIGFQ